MWEKLSFPACLPSVKHTLWSRAVLDAETSDGLMENIGLLVALYCLHWEWSLLVLSHRCTCVWTDFSQYQGYDLPLGSPGGLGDGGWLDMQRKAAIY